LVQNKMLRSRLERPKRADDNLINVMSNLGGERQLQTSVIKGRGAMESLSTRKTKPVQDLGGPS